MTGINPSDICKLEEIMTSAQHPVITTHMKPDGDAMGSSLAIYHIFKMLGKKDTRIILNDRFPAYLDFMVDENIRDNIMIMDDDADAIRDTVRKSDLLICLDFNSFKRTDRLQEILEDSGVPAILIDHHIGPDKEKFILTFSEQNVSSASELLFHILMATSFIDRNARRLPPEAATALMTGMTTDTNNFSNSVYPSTLQMASALLEAGVNREVILYNLFNRFSENRLRLLGHMLKDLLKITDDNVAYIVLDKETLKRYEIQEGDTEGFVNMPLSIGSVRMSILLKEEEGKARVSIRSKKGTSANRCAAAFFNGGGHENASGGKLNIPEDIADIRNAGEYIERCTHIFMTEYNG